MFIEQLSGRELGLRNSLQLEQALRSRLQREISELRAEKRKQSEDNARSTADYDNPGTTTTI